jgi:hypothetical protein
MESRSYGKNIFIDHKVRLSSTGDPFSYANTKCILDSPTGDPNRDTKRVRRRENT